MRDADGDPVVHPQRAAARRRHADAHPLLARATRACASAIGTLEADGGVRQAEAAVDPDELAAAHAAYAAERDAAIPAGHAGPRPVRRRRRHPRRA